MKREDGSMRKRILSGIIAFALTFSMFSVCGVPEDISADAVPTVTVGADLTEQQVFALYNTLGIDPNAVEILTIDNAMERHYLEGKISDDIIGTRTLSCAYILPMSSGGLVVKAANLTWVTEGMIANALLTAGVENCQVYATAPFAVSGTGALTGVLKAYESSADVKLDEEKKDTATQELIITGELTDEISASEEQGTDVKENNDQVIEFMNEIKTEAANEHLTEEQARDILDAAIKQFNISFSDEMYGKLLEYLMTFSTLEYDKDFSKSLKDLTDRIKEGFNVNININVVNGDMSLETGYNFIKQFFVNLVNYIKYVFGDFKVNINVDTTGIKNNIFSTIDGIKDEIVSSADSLKENIDSRANEREEVPEENIPQEDNSEEIPEENMQENNENKNEEAAGENIAEEAEEN